MIKNKKMFKECLERKGLDLKGLAQKSCIPFISLLDKKYTLKQFELSEIQAITRVLNLKNEEVDEIFFNE